PQLAVLLDRLADDSLQLSRHGGVKLPRRNGHLVQDTVEDDGRGGAVESSLAGGHLVEYGAEAEQVGASIQVFASRLFGRHVGHGAHGGTGGGEVLGVD